ncbi:LysR family transcriptional regulator [Buttiauxella gaviniae ATCC 51604]|uniref:LysR family transcriptional regulator n=1 Tax=Buttiauxella gaviniae ATCC 51604 TaxID=1354253 RepID=A0A1B7I6S1_9ENTR|nr:LysR family transcriptional regulator [Buttiauxella gaviniae]OAT24174.1 LysR family transcriptional regulator [Buttiauxella gaviniae ATCC 51604]
MDNYNQLLAFIWAYEHGNFSAAARANGLTPSAMSKLISRLETRLQVRLFYRGTRTLTLTEEGHVYLHSARAVVDAMAEANSLAEDMPTRISGQLKIRTMTSFARHQILPWLPDFIESYPALSVDIETGPVYRDDFDKGLDLAIYGGVLASSSRIARRIGESQWITCASPAYINRHGNPSHPRELMDHRCFHFNFESHWNQWVFAEGNQSIVFPVKPIASLSQGDLLRDLAIQGEGIVRLADFHIHRDIKEGRLIPLLEAFQSPIREPLYTIYAKRQHLSPRIRCFIEFMEKQIALHPWSI